MNAAPSSARRIGIGALAVAVLTLTGCAAGQHAQTADEVPVVDGVMANAGPIALRAVTVAAPPADSFPVNGDAPMELVIINDGAADDQLEGVTTSAANEVRFFSSLPATDTSAATSSDSSSAESTPSETPASGSSSSSSSSDVGTIQSINLPMGRATSIGYTPDLPQIQLHGLTSRLFPAESFPITFQFARAGSVTFTVSVHLAPGPSSTPSLDVAPTAAD